MSIKLGKEQKDLILTNDRRHFIKMGTVCALSPFLSQCQSLLDQKKIMHKIFDAHFHIIDFKYPLIENQGYIPPEFTIESYKEATASFNIIGGAVVSGSFQGFDQGYLINALHVLGPRFVGVTQLPASVSEEKIIQLNNKGVRAVRFNLKRGGSEQIQNLQYLSDKVYSLVKWHVELYVDAKDLTDLTPTLLKIKKFSIDHLGLSKEGFPALKKLIEKGGYVKATGFGRLNFEPIPALRELVNINPRAVLFGTDLPSTRAARAFSEKDIEIIIQSFTKNQAKQILCNNALEFYGISAKYY